MATTWSQLQTLSHWCMYAWSNNRNRKQSQSLTNANQLSCPFPVKPHFLGSVGKANHWHINESRLSQDDIMTRKFFQHFWPFCEGNPPIASCSPRKGAFNPKLCCFCCYYPEQAMEQTIKLLVKWDAMALMSCWGNVGSKYNKSSIALLSMRVRYSCLLGVSTDYILQKHSLYFALVITSHTILQMNDT